MRECAMLEKKCVILSPVDIQSEGRGTKRQHVYYELFPDGTEKRSHPFGKFRDAITTRNAMAMYRRSKGWQIVEINDPRSWLALKDFLALSQKETKK